MFLSSAFGPCALGRPVAAGRVGLGPREDSGARSGRPHTGTAARAPQGRWRQPRSPTQEPLAPRDAGGGASAAAMFPHASRAAEAPGWGRWPCVPVLALGAGARASGGLPVGSALGRPPAQPPAQPPGNLGRGAGGGLPVRGGVGQTAGRETFPVLGCRPPSRKRPAGAQAGESEGLCWASLASGPRDPGCQDPQCPTLARSVPCDGEAPWPLLPGYHRT